MDDDAELWADALGAWVLLSKLPTTIERVLAIPKSGAIPVLRLALEIGDIHAQVLGWSDSLQEGSDWVWTDRNDNSVRLTTEGWQHVDWKRGTLAGHSIRVRWDHVRQKLATLTAKVQREQKQGPSDAGGAVRQGARTAGGAPPRHDWDAFWIEVALYAAKNDLDPNYRQELQAHTVAWAAETSSEPPDDATIRSKLARLFKTVAAEQQVNEPG
jgi:hypothetical protein